MSPPYGGVIAKRSLRHIRESGEDIFSVGYEQVMVKFWSAYLDKVCFSKAAGHIHAVSKDF